MQIRIDDVTGAEVRQLLEEHLSNMALHSPPESVHALNIEELRSPGITFWTGWENGDLMGCGALLELNVHHAEIKSMRTSAAHLRKGVATRLLIHIIDEAKRRGYTRLSLETGSAAAFEPARKLYANFGFTVCGPFNGYVPDPYSVFMTRELG
jgi:putative acetyltransferase